MNPTTADVVLLFTLTCLVSCSSNTAPPTDPAPDPTPSMTDPVPGWQPIQMHLGISDPHRAESISVVLPDGDVLMCGGTGPSERSVASCERWNPKAQKWTAAAPMSVPRTGATGTLLSDGTVLVVGGYDTDHEHGLHQSAERYDPSKNTWNAVTPPSTPRSGHHAVRARDGRVLIIAGVQNDYARLASTEWFDPATSLWTAGGSLPSARDAATVQVLPDGRILLAGGTTQSATESVASASLYDPTTNTWAPLPAMPQALQGAGSALVNGRVLLVGGLTRFGPRGPEFSAQSLWFDPKTPSWSAGPELPAGRGGVAALALPDGRVVIAGGNGFANATVDVLTLDGKWRPMSAFDQPWDRMRAHLLDDGRMLFTGGSGSPGTATLTPFAISP